MSGRAVPTFESSSSSQPNSRSVAHSAVAGWVAGVTGTVIGHPIDSMKVWKQTGKSIHTSSSSSKMATTTATVPASSSCSQQHPQQQRTTYSKGNNITVLYQSAVDQYPRHRRSNDNNNKQLRRTRQCYRSLTTTHPTNTNLATSAFERGAIGSSSSSRFSQTATYLRALYAGMAGPLVTVGLVQSFNFGVYDASRRFLYHNSVVDGTVDGGGYQQDCLSHVAIAAAVTGGASALLTNPLVMIKVKQQTQALSYRQALQSVINWQGCVTSAARNIYTGFGPHVATEVVGRTVYFCTYETLKRRWATSVDNNNSNTKNISTVLTLPQRMLAASSAGVACWCVIYPLDALRSRVYAATAVKKRSPSSVTHTAMQLYRTGGGLRAFYRGFSLSLLRAGPVHACVLPMYDFALAELSSTDW